MKKRNRSRLQIHRETLRNYNQVVAAGTGGMTPPLTDHCDSDSCESHNIDCVTLSVTGPPTMDCWDTWNIPNLDY